MAKTTKKGNTVGDDDDFGEVMGSIGTTAANINLDAPGADSQPDEKKDEKEKDDKTNSMKSASAIADLKSTYSQLSEDEWYKANTTINFPPELRSDLEIIEKALNMSGKALLTSIVVQFLQQNSEEYKELKKSLEKKKSKWM